MNRVINYLKILVYTIQTKRIFGNTWREAYFFTKNAPKFDINREKRNGNSKNKRSK